MARPRKTMASSTGKIGKKERLEREVQESKLKVDRSRLLADIDDLNFFNEEAKQEFIRVVKEATCIQLLDNLDLATLKMYADSWAMYNLAIKSLSKYGLTILNEGKVSKNPALDAYNSAVKTINQCSTKLGLATTDRLKLIVPTKEEKHVNKFLQFVQ